MDIYQQRAHDITGRRAWRFTDEDASPAQAVLEREIERYRNIGSIFGKFTQLPGRLRQYQYIVDGMTGALHERRHSRLKSLLTRVVNQNIFRAITKVFQRKSKSDGGNNDISKLLQTNPRDRKI